MASWQQAATMPASVLKEGWLWKKGKIRKNWKRRFFVLLSNRQLEYFEKEHMECPKGKINLNTYGISINPTQDNSAQERGFGFDLATPGRTYVLTADDQEDYDNWYNLLMDEIPRL